MSSRMRWGHRSLLWKSANSTDYVRPVHQPTKAEALFLRVAQARLKRDFQRRQDGR